MFLKKYPEHLMSVPKVRRSSSPEHVSDRLRRAINCCSERSTSTCYDDTTRNHIKSSETFTRIQMSSNYSESNICRQGSSNRRPFCETQHADDETSTQLPQKVLKLVVKPCINDKCHCSIQSANHEHYYLNIFEICFEVLKELKYEVKTLIGVNALVPCSETPILGLINDCFQGQNPSVLDNRTDLLQYAKTLTVECVEIIEKVIHQQSEVVQDFKEEKHLSTRKKIKTLLLKVMLGIEQELINSEKILEIIETDLHYPSFQFIYCLLKYVIEKIEAHLKVSSSGCDLSNPQIKVMSHDQECVVESNFIHPVSGQAVIPDHKVEEYSSRLDKLLKQWTGTRDSSCKKENSQQVVVDCFHCLTGRKDQDVLLQTVSHFTEEMKRRMISCHQVDNRTHSQERSEDNQLEASTVEEPSNNTVGNTEISTYYSWMMEGPNHSHRDRSSRHWSQYSNCQTPVTKVSTTGNKSLRQLCTRNNSTNHIDPFLHLAPPCNIRSLSPSITNHNNCRSVSPQVTRQNNYCGKSPPISDGNNNNNRGMSTSISSENNHLSKSPPIADGNEYHRKYQPVADSNSYRGNFSLPNGNNHRGKFLPMNSGNIWPTVNGNNNFSMPQSLSDVKNYRTMSPPLVLPPFPKFQLPNLDQCKTIGTQGRSHAPRCTGPDRTNQIQQFCSHGNQMIGNCGRCLVICENNPKPSYYDRFPGFKNEGLYGHRYCNTFQPKLFNSFSVSPEYEDGKKNDKKWKDKNKERKSTSLDGERKGSMTAKQRRSLSPFKGRRSLSPNIDGKEKEQVSGRNNEKRKPPTKDDKKQNIDDEKKAGKGKKDKPQRKRSPDKDIINKENRIPEIENDSISSKETYMNKVNTTKDELEFDENPTPRPRTNEAKPSTLNSPDSSKPSKMKKTDPPPEALKKNYNNQETLGNKDKGRPIQESKTREDDVKDNNSTSSPTNKKQNDDHCSCCHCKKNNGNGDDSRAFATQCRCGGTNNQDTNSCYRPIYQFFANPIPVACNCQNKSDANKTTQEVQKSKSSQQMDSTTSNISQNKRDSQDAETQTAKKSNKSETLLLEPYSSEPSAGQITPARSKNDQVPCIEKSESCTCTVIFSRSSSKHKRDSKSNETQTQKTASKSDSKCKCPQDIEDIFQNFDDKYSKCVQEIKLRIREGLIPRFNGSDESFTVTREITITPSRSTSANKENKPTKEPPQQQLRFQANQDKFYSDDSLKSAKSHENHMSRDLREDIEELKRLVKNTRIGHCPCCKCCKCEDSGNKVEEECSVSKAQGKGSPDSEKELSKNEPGKHEPESSTSRNTLSNRHPSKNSKELNKVQPKGTKVVHISPSYVGDELPPSVQKPNVLPESPLTKAKVPNPEEDSSPKKLQKNPREKSVDVLPKKYDVRESEGRNSSTGSRSLGESHRQIGTESDKDTTNTSPKKDDLNESKDGIDNMKVTKLESMKDPRALKKMTSPRSSNKNELEIADQSPEKGENGPSRYESYSYQQLEETAYGEEPQTKRTSGNRMRLSKISVSESKLSIVISSEALDAAESKGERSDTDRKNTVSPHTTNSYDVDRKNKLEKDPLLVAEGEYAGANRDATGMPMKNQGLKWEDKMRGEISEASLQNDSEVWQNRNADQNKSKKSPAERKLKSSGYDSLEATSEKQQREINLVYDDETDQQRNMSLERRALDDSREQLFTRRTDDNVPIEREKQYLSPIEDENKNSWNPFDGLFGIFGAKAEEPGTSKEDGIHENVQDRIDEETESAQPELRDPYERDCEEDPIDSDFSSCDAGNPCRSTYSSSSTIDECRDLLDSLPCNFYSEESVTVPSSISEVIKATETELYVMIIESQPPVAPATNSHDEIISLLLSVNNNGTNLPGNGNLEKHLKANKQGNVSHTSTPNSYLNTKKTFQECHGSLPCFPVELISLQPSYDSIKLVSDIESSNEFLETSHSNDRTRLIKRICSHNPQQEMRERKSSCHSKQEEKEHPRPCLDQPEKRKRPGDKPRKHSGDLAVPSLETRLSVEEVEITKKTENKEVQVMKWNAKVQTAGPRKFNRTDITREVEDKLAVYLGLERTVEQMDLKVTQLEEEAPRELLTQRDTKNRGKPNKRESKKKI